MNIIKLFTQLSNPPKWDTKSYQDILQMKMKDVYIPLEKTGLLPYLKKLQDELDQKGLHLFKPYFWFSDEWFTPDGHTGIAIPFYLAHKKLAKIQESQIYDVEGGTPTNFMKLLRHECGHAIDNAYRLRRKKERQNIFGKSSEKYEDTYVPKPFSKKYVRHLNGWYSQSHPDEDFAETFAVWLNPRSAWKKKYKNWQGAFKKLKYMEKLMEELVDVKPLISTRKRIDPQNQMNKLLIDHYNEKREYYGVDYPNEFDVHLLKLFTNNPEMGNRIKAANFIKSIQKDVRKSVTPWTGAYQYTINEIIQLIIKRCNELNLLLKLPKEESKNQFIAMLSVVTLEYIHNGSHKIAR